MQTAARLRRLGRRSSAALLPFPAILTAQQVADTAALAPITVERLVSPAYPNRTLVLVEREGTVPHLYHLPTRYLTTNLPAEQQP